ncbi:MAG: type IV pilus inner membrane component PilO [Gaiellaceae bacterium]
MNVKKQKLSGPAAGALIGVVSLLVLIVGMFLLVLPQRSEASKLAKQIDSTQTQITQARALAEQKPAQPIRYADLFKLVKAMPDQVDMTGIILQLQQTASDSGLSFDSIQPGGAAVGNGYAQIPIQVTFDGNYFSLTDFLFRLRNLVAVRGGALNATGRMFSVDTLDFSAGVGGFPQISARMTINAYVYGTNIGTSGSGAAAPPAAATTTTTDTTATTTTTSTGTSGTPPVAGGVNP